MVKSKQKKVISAISPWDTEIFKRAYRLSLGLEKKKLTLRTPEKKDLAWRLNSESICHIVLEFLNQTKGESYIQESAILQYIYEGKLNLRFSRDLGIISNAEFTRWDQDFQDIAKLIPSLKEIQLSIQQQRK